MNNLKNTPDDAMIVSRISHDRFYLYMKSKPNGMVDIERCSIPVSIDVDGSLCGLPQKEQADKLNEKFWNSFENEVNEHFKNMIHHSLNSEKLNTELIFPSGPFDERVDLAEMLVSGRSVCFKIKIGDDIYPVIFETYNTIENGVNHELERNSFLYPYPCHIVLCHISVETMKFAIEMLSQTEYFSQLMPINKLKNKSKLKIKKFIKPSFTFKNESDEIVIETIDGINVVSVNVTTFWGKKYKLNFFDIDMIKSAMGLNENATQKWMFFSSPNMVILNKLTIPEIKKCINELWQDGAFDYYK